MCVCVFDNKSSVGEHGKLTDALSVCECKCAYVCVCVCVCVCALLFQLSILNGTKGSIEQS